jgi:hypothetical protein
MPKPGPTDRALAGADAAEVRREYTVRLSFRQAEERRWDRRSALLSAVRLGVFLTGILLTWLALRTHVLSVWWLIAPAIVFAGLMVVHEVVLDRKRRAAAAAAYYQDGLDRLDHRWIGRGPSGDDFADPKHPFAADLDLFGDGSLFQLLCRARTSQGQETLARWLLQPASVKEALSRQEAVRELAAALDLREDLAVLGAGDPSKLRLQGLVDWQQAPGLLRSRRVRTLAVVLTFSGLLAAGAWAAHLVRATPLLIVLLLQGIYRFRVQRQMRAVIGVTDMAMRDLPLMAAVLGRLERERFLTAHLQALRRRLDTDRMKPSRRLRRLERLQDCFEARRNVLFAPISYPLLWDIHAAIALESWRERHGTAVVGWFKVIGECEALASLACVAYESPQDVYPQFTTDGPLLEGVGLGHPLLADPDCVRNDLRLDRNQSLLIISGSNMSGKSTWLRTVGLLHVLAFAGAPVRARTLRLSRLTLGASIRIQDSLHSGVSHFAAEVQRLKQIVDLTAQDGPVLYLVDEVLQGTNSHDRRVGTEAVLHKLLSRGAVGLITTHDLALTEMAEALGSRVANVHFQDRVIDGMMVFDYRVHPGVIERSNALDLMRAAGLEV